MGYEKRQFLYGMDFDTEERLVEQGFTRKNVNVRIGSSTDSGVLSAENVQGNKLIPNTELPTGDNKVIGAYWNKLKDLNYYFVWNSDGNHGIYEYDHVPAKIKRVMIAEVLNFQQDKLITGVNVVQLDNDNDLLYWTDGYNPPRKINIQKAKKDEYVTPIKEEVVDAIKYPPLCPPTTEFEDDPDYKLNLLEDKIYQFKASYFYDDNEESAYSPISLQTLPATSCGSSATQGNTIKITIPKGGELVTRVRLAAREGNVADFVEIADDQILDISTSSYELDVDGNYVYTFRGDKIPRDIPLSQSNKLYDWIPQTAKAQEFIQNRITYANITEGYDNVDVDFDLEVTYEEEVVTSENTIKGVLRISQQGGDSDFSQFQPIHEYNGEYVYGGFGADRGSLFDPDAFEEDLSSNFNQQIPLGGFVLYLAGTEYYTVSEQIDGNPYGAAIQDSKNVYNSGSRKNRNIIRDELQGSSQGLYPQTRVYSQWQFDNIPDGTYIIRVASNMTTSQDLLDPDRGYQKTSPLLNRIGFSTTVGSQQKVEKELEITVSGGQIIDDIEVVIADLSTPGLLNAAFGIAGYLIDDGEDYDPASISEALGRKRVELSRVNITNGQSDYVITDHNGFFFNKKPTALSVFDIKTGVYNTASNQREGYDFFDTSPNPPKVSLVNQSRDSAKYFVISVNNNDVTNYARTNVVAQVRNSSGNPVSGVNIVSTNGDVQTTGSDGVANFIVYAEASETSRSAEFYPYVASSCNASFNFTSLNFTGNIGNVSGYLDFGDFTNLSTWIVTLSDISGQGRLKNGGIYNFGIVYYDRANRSGATNVSKDSELILPFYTEVSPAISTAPVVAWQINSLAPNWATHYQWVRTPNTATNQYLQWFTDEVAYSVGGTNFNDASIIELDITNLTDEYTVANPDSVLVYDFTERDRIRFIKDNAGSFFDSYIDLKVLGFSAGVLKVENRSDVGDISQGVFFEIYTPQLDVDEDIYYEIGECLEVLKTTDAQGNTLSYHQGRIQDQDPFNPTTVPAQGIFQGGDTYYRNRAITATNGIFKTDIDSQLFSDFWQSRISDIGRPNKIDKDAKTVHRPTAVLYTEKFIPESNINGLNSIFDLSVAQYDRAYGSIQKLYSKDKRLDCFQELKVGQILVEESVLYSSNGNPNLTYSDSVLSDMQYYTQEFGTMNPESFTENEGRRYFFDIRNGKVLRLSTDGMTPISDNKMHSYFESKSNFYSAFGIIPEIWGTYDKDFDEYVISFGEVSRDEGFTPDDLALVGSQAETVTEERNGLTYTFIIGYEDNAQGVDTNFEIVRDVANGTYVINSNVGDLTLDRQKVLSIPAETVGFSERTKHWTSFYSYTPECMSRVGIVFLTFRNGQAFLHNQSGKRNMFYGSQYSSESWVIFNQDPSNNKVYQALSEESDTVWEAREILTLKGQRSNLIKDDFEVDMGQGHTIYSKENIHYAALWQDENTPNVDLPLINGDSMRDTSILFKLVNESEEEERLYAASVRYSLSPRTNR